MQPDTGSVGPMLKNDNGDIKNSNINESADIVMTTSRVVIRHLSDGGRIFYSLTFPQDDISAPKQ